MSQTRENIERFGNNPWKRRRLGALERLISLQEELQGKEFKTKKEKERNDKKLLKILQEIDNLEAKKNFSRKNR